MLVFSVLLSMHRVEERCVPWVGAMKPPRAACYCCGGIKMSWERASGKEASRMPADLCGHAENPSPRWVENSWTIRAGQACGFLGDVLGLGQTHYGSPSQPFHRSPRQWRPSPSSLKSQLSPGKRESSRSPRHKKHKVDCKSHLGTRKC